jgi:hypothetical protein
MYGASFPLHPSKTKTMNSIKSIATLLVVTAGLLSCKKENNPGTPAAPKLIVKIQVDPTLGRLGNTGQPASLPSGHAGQNPVVRKIGAHYLEFSQTALTPIGGGDVLYHAPETTLGGGTAIDFDQSKVIDPGAVFLELPLSELAPGTYTYARLSLSYQNGDVQFYFGGLPYTGTLASFVGYNTYIRNFSIKNQQVAVNANKAQGYWGFETVNGVTTGQAPPGATTVPNPIFATSPIPAGSCLVTGAFNTPLVISGNETGNVVVNLNLSTNKSFEWIDGNNNGRWDVDQNENIVDMGLRGLFPTYTR